MTFAPFKIGYPANDLLRLNAYWNTVYSDVVNPINDFRFARMWHQDCTVTSGGGLLISSVGVEPFARYPYYAPWRIVLGEGATFEQYFLLNAGTYDFIVTCATNIQGGIVQWSLDANAIGNMDFYSAAADAMLVKTISSVVIATSGQHTLSALVNTKNAASISYDAVLYKYCFREAAL